MRFRIAICTSMRYWESVDYAAQETTGHETVPRNRGAQWQNEKGPAFCVEPLPR
jgi:hypothetical protein